MIRTVFATAVVGLIFAAVPGTSQAMPIAPLPAGVTSETGGLTQVYWRHYGHHYGHRYGHRHCWRGRWGHVHCGW